MPRISVLSIVLALLSLACTSEVNGGQAVGPTSCGQAIDSALQAWEGVGFSGSVAFLGGEQPCVSGYGFADPETTRPVTPDTVFSIGSITKAVTAVAIAGLVDDGLLTYEDLVGHHLPELAGPAAEATIGQLLLHTGGLTGSHGRDQDPLARDEAITAISELERSAPPGQQFLYSNAGYTTLALVIDELTGSYRDHLRDRILTDGSGAPIGGFWNGEPSAVGPRAVGTTDDGERGQDGSFSGPHWGLDGSGGVAMTAGELASWTRAVFNGRIISQDAVDAMLAVQFDQDPSTAEVPGWVRLDAEAFGEPLYGSSGGGGEIGHEMTVAYLPESDRVFVVASNSPEVRAEGLLEQLLPPILDGQMPVGPDAGGEIEDDTLAAAVGTWQFDDGLRFEISKDGTAIRATPLDGAAIPLLLPVPDRDDADRHEKMVLEVIDGGTEEGRNERRLLEEEFGPITTVEAIGTWFAEFEYRTYVSIGFDRSETILWLALDDAGGIAAAQIEAEMPSLRLLAAGPDSFKAIDPASEKLGIRITVTDMELTVTNNGTTRVAARIG